MIRPFHLDRMMQFDIRLTCPNQLLRLYRKEAPQKDHFCGAFWGALALQSAGIAAIGDQPVDQDLIAHEAGTTLEEGDPYSSLPPGAEPRTDYRLRPPVADNPESSGTSSAALREAIDRCAGDALSVIPVAGPWSETSVRELPRVFAKLEKPATLIANLRTGQLWGARPDLADVVDYLEGGDPIAPAADWDVGHFVALALTISSDRRTVFGVLDTYPSLGWGGYHLQPANALAAALNRSDGQQGGVLCVSHAAEAPLKRSLERAGFELRDWDNGSCAAA